MWAPARISQAPGSIGELASLDVAVSPASSNAEVMALFEARPDLHGVVLVDQGAPVGLINRTEFFAGLARPFARELFLRRECSQFANLEPLVLDAGASISEAGSIAAAAGEKVLSEGCIVVRDGLFAGLCSGITLVRALSELQEEQHRRLISSIEYAAAIQDAMLADSRMALQNAFPGRCQIVWRPRDLVGGDCFFAAQAPDGVLVGLMDCTGHGVPGALLTSIAISEASRLSTLPKVRRSPAAMLSHLSRRMKEALQQRDGGPASSLQADDGMDAAFLWIDAAREEVSIASANLPVFLLDPAGQPTMVKGDRRGVGYRDTPAEFEWTERRASTREAARILIATDGLPDQIGGARSLAFGWSGVRRSLEATAGESLERQVQALWSAFEAHQGGEPRRDDVTLMGFDLRAPIHTSSAATKDNG